MATKTRLTLEEFLALPETEPPSEFVDGEVIQKVSPNIYHGALAARLAARFSEWAARSAEAFLVSVEGRHVAPALNRVYLPDVHVTKLARLAGHEGEAPMTVAPDVVVEVLSPDDRAAHVLDKIEMYVALGVPALLVVDPEERTVREYRESLSPQLHREGDTIDLSPVLPGFVLDGTDLFSVLPARDQE